MSSGFISSEEKEKNLGDLQLISFALEGQQYGANIGHVKEVVRMIEVTKVPKAPRFVEGVINYRGEIIFLLDLRKYLGLENTENNNLDNPIIIIHAGDLHFGVIVDSVSEVFSISKSLIEPVPEIHPLAEFLEGAVKLEGKLVLLLNFEKGLKNSEKKLFEKITKAFIEKIKNS